jgi:hypothetical protein
MATRAAGQPQWQKDQCEGTVTHPELCEVGGTVLRVVLALGLLQNRKLDVCTRTNACRAGMSDGTEAASESANAEKGITRLAGTIAHKWVSNRLSRGKGHDRARGRS